MATEPSSIIVECLFLLVLASSCKTKPNLSSSPPTNPLDAFQADADIFRLRHLRYYGGLIEEFRAKTGAIPFENRHDYPVYVLIGHEGQSPKEGDTPPYQHEVIPMTEFIATLEKGLGRTVDEYYDPQYASVHRPNFYIYMVVKDVYFLAVHVNEAFSFAKTVGLSYYKVEISNRPGPDTPTFEQLLRKPDFIQALKRVPHKEGFFLNRDQQHLHDSKQER